MATYTDLPYAQAVRVLDVFVIGPIMLYGAVVPSRMATWARVALGIFGVATIGYNATNFVRKIRSTTIAASRSLD